MTLLGVLNNLLSSASPGDSYLEQQNTSKLVGCVCVYFLLAGPLELYFELLVYFTSLEAFQSFSQYKAVSVCVSGSEEVCIPSTALLLCNQPLFKVAFLHESVHYGF